MELKKKLSRKILEFFLKVIIITFRKSSVRRCYLNNVNKKLDLKKCNALMYTEKIQFLKIYQNNKLVSEYSDKLNVRSYVSKKGYKHILPRIYGVYESAKDIDFSKLPNEYVLKLNHGWGYNLIVNDAVNVSKEELKNQLDLWKNSIFGLRTAEVQYFYIKPIIYAEEYLLDSLGKLYDYKIYCFDGKPKYIQVDVDRFGNHYRNIYDLDWNYIDMRISYPNCPTKIDKPKNLEDMIKISRELSNPFLHVRVDLYNVDGKIYFSELTFTPAAGYMSFSPQVYDNIFGENIDLSKL